MKTGTLNPEILWCAWCGTCQRAVVLSGSKERLACSMLPALAKNLDLLSRNWFDGVQFHTEAFRRSDRIDPVKPKNNRQQSVFCPRRAYFWGTYPEHLNTHNWSGTSFAVTVATCVISKKQGARGCQDEVAAHVRQKHIQANISFVLKWISIKICAALE